MLSLVVFPSTTRTFVIFTDGTYHLSVFREYLGGGEGGAQRTKIYTMERGAWAWAWTWLLGAAEVDYRPNPIL